MAHSTTSSNLLSKAISRQNEDVAKSNGKRSISKNGKTERPHISQLGKDLRKLREQYIASGGKLLNRRELDREIAERRGSR
jgi:hypothetical protein